MSESVNGVTILNQDQAAGLLATALVGRLAFAHEGQVELLPLNIAVRDGVVYFRTAKDSILAALREPHDVVLEADHIEELYQLAWSVLVRGTTRHVHDPDTLAALRAQGRPRSWAGDQRDLFIAIDTTSITGRRVHRPH